MHNLIPLAVLFALAAVFALLYLYAKRKKEDVAAALKSVIAAAWRKGLVLDHDLIAKVFALENGGHLAAGTTDALHYATIAPASGTNGGQPAQTSTAATT